MAGDEELTRPLRLTVDLRESGGTGVQDFTIIRPLLWAVYLTLAPIVWLPLVSASTLSITKTVAFAAAVATTWASSRNRSLPAGLLGPMGLTLILVGSAFAMFLSFDDVATFRGVAEPILAFAMIWTAYVYQRGGGDLWRSLNVATALLSVAALFVVLAWVGWEIVGRSPAGNPISLVGFATSRGTWGSAVAVYFPIGLAASLTARSRYFRVLAVAVVLALPGSILAVGSRSALLASLVGGALVLWYAVDARLFWATVAASGLAVWRMPTPVASHLRFYRLDRLSLDSLDDFSAGRVGGYLEGLAIFWRHPLTGRGFGQAQVARDSIAGRDYEIHNLWLKSAAEGGVFLLLAVASVIAMVVVRSYRFLAGSVRSGRSRQELVRAAGLFGALIAGVIASLFEPNALLGNMHTAAAWWMCAGLAVAGESLLRR